ncbi:nucleotidyl transferase AbiEii/AbiGii toxin family protein [Candidatus Bipolaricaulota bacterium]|nr:nucleotidyl transferase AbiEii/AbiGii toxin family protein [Candidatus Bipolaricaulota bacterium]
MHPEVLTEQGKQIFPQLGRFDEFYLAGGTGLALQVGHRISEDFDLFTRKQLSDGLLESVEKVLRTKKFPPR